MSLESGVETPTVNGKQKLKDALVRLSQHRAEARFDAALNLLKTLMAEHGEIPLLLGQRGATRYEMGDAENGLNDLRRATEAAPEDPVLAADYGAFLARDGQQDEALFQLRNAVERAPKYAIARSNLGGLLVLKEQYREAITHLKAALDLEPRFVDAAVNLANAYNTLNRSNEAADALYRALSVEPNAPGLHLEIAQSLYRAERHDTALYHIEKAIDLADEPGPALLVRARIMAARGEMQSAANDLLRAATRPRLAVGAMTQLIRLRRTETDAPEVQFLEKALKKLDDMPKPTQRSLKWSGFSEQVCGEAKVYRV